MDENPTQSGLLCTALQTVLQTQHPAGIWRLAAKVQFRHIDGDRRPTEHHAVATQMIARGSGEIRP